LRALKASALSRLSVTFVIGICLLLLFPLSVTSSPVFESHKINAINAQASDLEDKAESSRDNATSEKEEHSDVIYYVAGLILLLLFLVFAFYSQLQLKRYNIRLKQSESRYARAVKGTQDGIWDWDLETNKVYLSPRWKALIGYSKNELGDNAREFFTRIHHDDMEGVKQAKKEHLENGSPYDLELRLKNKDGSYRWYRAMGQAEYDDNGVAKKMAGTLSDITEKKQAIDLEVARNQVLELTAKGESFGSVLDAIVDIIERENPQMLASILLLKNNRLYCGSAPNLPANYSAAIEGAEIGYARGSCGTAAFIKERVIVSDIQSHEYWEDFKGLAAQANLRSCWSEPIFDSKREVLGTFAIYHSYVCEPTDFEIRLIENAATLAGIAIERSQTTEQLRLASLVYENSSEAMLIFGADRSIMAVNPAFTEITGYTAEEIVGKQADILNSEFYEEHFYKAMSLAVKHTGNWQGEVKDRRKNGEIYYRWLTINTIFNEDGSIHRRVALFSDITERKKSEQIIWEQANYDSLTGLPNRNMFNDRLNQQIKNAKRNKSSFGLLLLDLDRFKEVNDTLGHDFGDILLVEAANRINEAVREMDTVARLGGDEFTIILSELDEDSHIETVAQKIVDKLAEPFQLNEEIVYVSASVGITLYPDDSENFESLLKNADQAMYEAKNLGRNRYQYFTHSMQEAAQNRMRLVADLRVALSKSQFEVYYQPIVDLSSGEICKAEALIRWHHPERGVVRPSEFISIAEETGIIVELGEWVLKEAIQQINIWRETINPNFQISVNTSPAQYQSKNSRHNRWLTHFKKTNTKGNAIVMEITEGMMMDASSMVTNQLIGFRNSGIQVALDDFGTGYSSLSYLKRFDIDYIKIDRAFVKNLESDEDDRILCEAIIVMAQKLNLKVIAEGVETEGQKDILKNIGCDFAQGYLFSEPVNSQTLESLAKNR